MDSLCDTELKIEKQKVNDLRVKTSLSVSVLRVQRVALLHFFSTTIVFVRSFSVFWFAAKTKKLKSCWNINHH